MNNFYKICSGMDVAPLMAALHSMPDLWNKNTLRTEHVGTAHSEVDDIWLRFNDTNTQAGVVNDKECINYPAIYKLPAAADLVFWLAGRVRGEQIGRALITRLAPGGKIKAHRDMGAPAEFYERYHIVLNGLPGSLFKCGGEQVLMQTGDVWWFDNSEEHEIINNSADDRVHIIVDVRPFK